MAALGVIFCYYVNHANAMKLQLRLLAALWLGAWTAGNAPLHAAGPAMQPYVIELPGHVLRFSLPVAMASGNWPVKQVTRFDPRDDSFARKDFYKVFSVLHDFNGPFWVGAYGSLKIHVMVQRRRAEFPGDIMTLDGLDAYVRSWTPTISSRSSGCVFAQVFLNGMPAVRRECDGFGGPNNQGPDHLVIFSLPLNDEIFLDVGFNVMAWTPDRAKDKKWKPKAEAWRELILATVVLERKASAPR